MLDRDLVKKLPKVELHYHLDGGIRASTIIELAKEFSVDLPFYNDIELGRWFHRGADRKSLALYLEGFGLTCSVMQTSAALSRVAVESLEQLGQDGVVYAEIRFSPILHQQRGLTLEEVVHAVLMGLEEGREKTGVQFGLILCAMRHQSSLISQEIAELAVSFRKRGVVGFDIAGDEYGHPPKSHLDAFSYIRSKNFNITIHAGEAFGIESIWQAVQICGTHRIGHATRLVDDMTIKNGDLIDMGSLSHFIRDRRIPLEICLSSNVHTGAAPSLESHPFGVFNENGFRTCLCTDNTLMSNTTLTDEMMIGVESFGLDLSDLEKLTINAMKSAFIHFDQRLKIIYHTIKPGFKQSREIADKEQFNG